ncbi:MAG: hypothetical protein JWM57_3679 [Phycisphaerales bacterium]|nr:hypothetical protein [Phycisphaerales bacterium]
MRYSPVYRRSVVAITLAAMLVQPIAPALLAAPAAPAPTPLELKMQKSFAAMEAVKRELPRDTFDPQGVLETVGTDPAALTAWVHDNTFYVPYDGTLRGPAGVLMDRTGNSLDRSLLLANLLKSAGFEVRLAQGTLSADVAKAQAALAAKAAPVSALAAFDEPKLRDAAKRFDLDADKLVNAVKGSRVEADRLAEDAAARIKSQTPALATAVGTLTPEAAPAPTVAHWWVQAKTDDKWDDFDPAAEPGKALTSAEKNLAPDALPDDLKHGVRIKVVVEQWDGGKLNEKTVLDHTLYPADLAGQQVSLVHTPLNWPSKVDASAAPDPAVVVVDQLKKQTEWLPLLTIGEQQVLKASFKTDGTINESPKPDATGNVGAAVGAGFGGLMGGGDAPAGDRTALTAEFIDYDIIVPGRPTRTIRRQVFDLIGPAARAAGVATKPGGADDARRLNTGLNLTGKVDMLLLGSRLPSSFVEMKMLSDVLAGRPMIEAIARQGQNLTEPEKKAFQPGPNAGSDLYTLALGRDLWSPAAAATYIAEPNVLTYHVQLSQNDKADVTACEGYDIVSNELAVRPGADAAQDRLQQGVVDTTAEAMLLGNCGKIHNTSELFATNGSKWTTLKGADAAIAKGSADAQTRIKADLAAGYVVVVPAELPDGHPLAWYRVDPKTGTALGIGQSGWGQSTTEMNIHNARFILNVLDTLLCLRSASHAGNSTAKGAGIIACMIKGTLKSTKLLIATPAAVGPGLVIDLMSDCAGSIMGAGLKYATEGK